MQREEPYGLTMLRSPGTTFVRLSTTIANFVPSRSASLVALLACLASGEPWKFAILGDTQWPDTARIPVKNAAGTVLKGSDGKDSTVIVDADSLSGHQNPNMVPAYFLHQIHERLRGHGVRFVLAVGDLSDYPTVESMRTRATWAQELYDAGIGFFPIRGNHDEGPVGAQEFLRVFPQTRTGQMNATPADAILWTDSANIHPFRAPSGKFAMGSSFSSPSCAKGRSYAFSDQGSTFVMVDQFMGTIQEGVKTCPMSVQIPWMDSVLSARPAGTPAFLVTHKPIIGACHSDNLFGDDPTVDTAGQARLFETLTRNKVEILFSGHDHQMQQAMIEEPGPRGLRIHQRIVPGASYKFYPPLKVDDEQNVPKFGKKRETLLAQDLGTVGYTVVEIDGPRMEVSDWSAPSGIQFGDLLVAPDLEGKWTLRRRWGASSRGRQTLLAQGDSLKKLSDSSQGTRVRILSGVWKAAKGDFYNRPFSALASTDWRRIEGQASAAWTLWGLEKATGNTATPTFALSMSIDPSIPDSVLLAGSLCLAREDSGSWKCVGSTAPRQGSWKTSDAVGARGIDPSSREAWAVVDRAGTFAVLDQRSLSVDPHKRATPFGRIDRKLSFSSLAGRETLVEVARPDGRLLERGSTRDGAWQLAGSTRGSILVRVREADGAWSSPWRLFVP